MLKKVRRYNVKKIITIKIIYLEIKWNNNNNNKNSSSNSCSSSSYF